MNYIHTDKCRKDMRELISCIVKIFLLIHFFTEVIVVEVAIVEVGFVCSSGSSSCRNSSIIIIINSRSSICITYIVVVVVEVEVLVLVVTIVAEALSKSSLQCLLIFISCLFMPK